LKALARLHITRQLSCPFQRKTEMPRFTNLLILFPILFCSPSIAYTQQVSTVAGRVKSVVQDKSTCWKLTRMQERKSVVRTDVEQEWLCGKESVTIYFYQGITTEAAINLFREMRAAPVASPGRSVDSHKFGDESLITTGALEIREGNTSIFFRQGDMVIRIDAVTMENPQSSSALKQAIRFAQIVAERLS